MTTPLKSVKHVVIARDEGNNVRVTLTDKDNRIVYFLRETLDEMESITLVMLDPDDQHEALAAATLTQDDDELPQSKQLLVH